MKIGSVLGLVIALGLCGTLSSRGDDLFQMFWNVKCYKTTRDGSIGFWQVTDRDFVNSIARNNNLNPDDLVFVYRPNKHDTAVVRKSNGAFVADVIQMEYNYTDVSNPNGTVIVRHALLYDEAHDVPLGSFFGIETRQLGPNSGLANDKLTGTVLYSKPNEGKVYTGTVSTGERIADRTGS